MKYEIEFEVFNKDRQFCWNRMKIIDGEKTTTLIIGTTKNYFDDYIKKDQEAWLMSVFIEWSERGEEIFSKEKYLVSRADTQDAKEKVNSFLKGASK